VGVVWQSTRRRKRNAWLPQRAKARCGDPFDFAQGRLLHCATYDETVSRFGRDDDVYLTVVEKRRRRLRVGWKGLEAVMD
jgi:hypothetical protein